MSLPDRDLVAEEREAARRASVGTAGPRPPALDQGTRRLALIAGGLGTLLVVLVGGWSLLGGHRGGGGIPVIEPLPGPVRVKPVDPGGMQLAGEQVAQTNGPAAQALAPGPEAAAPQALQAEVAAARHADEPAPPPTTSPAPPPAPPSPAAPPAAASAADPAAPVPAGEAAPPARPDADPAPNAVAPAAEPPPARRVPAPAAAGGHAVQLAALDSEAAAQAEWARLTRHAPVLLAGRHPSIVPVRRGDTRFFRLRTAGFGTIAEATAFCGQLRAAGLACTLADF